MSTGMVEIMKRAAMDAIENSKPCDLRFGTVVSVAPLKVQITAELIIPESLIVVPQHLTDHDVSVYVDVSTIIGDEFVVKDFVNNVDGESLIITTNKPEILSVSEERLIFEINDDSLVSVSDEVLIFQMETIKKQHLRVYNALNVGDKVVLIRNQGGKVYYILDRL